MLDRLSLRARRTLSAWTFLALPIAFYASIRLYPTAEALLTSLTDWNIVGPRRFVGLDELPAPGRGPDLLARSWETPSST